MQGYCRIRFGDVAVPALRDGATVRPLVDGPFGSAVATGPDLPADAFRYELPVLPQKVFAVGRNFVGGGVDDKRPAEPTLVIKPAWSLIGPEDPVVVPTFVEHLQGGAELAVVIGRRCRDATVATATDYVLGYTCVNDLTAMDFMGDRTFTRAKTMESFCALGPLITPDLPVGEGVRIVGRVNGEVVQEADTSRMIFGVEEVISFVSRYFTLEPGDVIAMGSQTPNPPFAVGDVLEVEIDGIGVLRNPVVALGAPVPAGQLVPDSPRG